MGWIQIPLYVCQVDVFSFLMKAIYLLKEKERELKWYRLNIENRSNFNFAFAYSVWLNIKEKYKEGSANILQQVLIQVLLLCVLVERSAWPYI